ncbi:MAG TPA: isocitrate lyase/phosphoenolpyruvate mutase family protein [Beijerinckiaceae bacterium]|nr:isocitrate lyase/phosphoenolpyruvate mutase family protein [Beijerinckiaceae bacterium]
MAGAAKLRARLSRGDNMVAIGTWDVLSAKVIERAGFDIAALQSFQWAAGWGLPDLGIKTPSELLQLTMKMAGEIAIPILVDFEEGFGSPGHAAYWAREFERAGAAAVHVDDKGPVHMCPWLPGSESQIQVSAAEFTADIIHAMARARREDLVIFARCQVRPREGEDSEREELRRLKMYIEAGADAVFAPKAATLSNDLGKLARAVRELGVPVLVQSNVPGYIAGYVPPDSRDGKSIADRSFDELFGCGVRIINTPQLYTVAYRAFSEMLGRIREVGNLQPARDAVLSFDEVLTLLGYDRFATQEQRGRA